MNDSDQTRQEYSYVLDLVSRLAYLQWCEHKSFDPHPWPYAGENHRAMAALLLKYTGWDDDVIRRLEADALDDHKEIK